MTPARLVLVLCSLATLAAVAGVGHLVWVTDVERSADLVQGAAMLAILAWVVLKAVVVTLWPLLALAAAGVVLLAVLAWRGWKGTPAPGAPRPIPGAGLQVTRPRRRASPARPGLAAAAR